jgi:hypothetical protein
MFRGDCRTAGPAIAPTAAFGYQLSRSEDVLVGLAPRKSAVATRPARRSDTSFRSALTSFAVALALVVQLIAMPYQQALARPAFAGSGAASIAADLQAMFGDAAGFCAHVDDRIAPAPHGPCNHCDGQCPLCRPAAQAAALVPLDAPNLPRGPATGRHPIGPAPEFGAFSACPTQRNRARAPPLAV